MRRLSTPFGVVALALASALVPGCGGDPANDTVPRDASEPLRIVTWNVHDLFDAVDRTSPPGDEDVVPSPGEVDAKIGRVGSVLARLDADVLVLEEVENVDLLRRLAAGPLSNGGRYDAYLHEGYDPRGIDVGVLSRVPFTIGPSHLDDRMPDGRRLWARDVPEIHLAVGPPSLVLLGAHLVSRIDPAEDARRLLQAGRLRAIASAIAADPLRPGVVVVGDLNDVPGSPALVPLLGANGCEDLARGLAASDAWTWSGGGAHERIDYALRCGGSVTVTRVEVEGGPDVAAASDHRPVVVDVWTGRGGQ